MLVRSGSGKQPYHNVDAEMQRMRLKHKRRGGLPRLPISFGVGVDSGMRGQSRFKHISETMLFSSTVATAWCYEASPLCGYHIPEQLLLTSRLSPNQPD